MAFPLANPCTKQEYSFRRETTWLLPLRRLLILWHLVSLDAPSVAVVWALTFAQIAGIHLQAWIALLLFSGTWSVYIGDRLLDAHRAMRSGRMSTLRERHYFHWRHRRILIPLASMAAVVAAALIAHRMPVAIRERNSLLAAAAVAYFSGVHSSPSLPRWVRKICSKELLVGVLFTAGCAAPTFWQVHFVFERISSTWPLFLCFACFAMLAWCNCRAIESWEAGAGGNIISQQSGLLAVVGSSMAAALAPVFPAAAAMIAAMAASSLLLLVLDRMQHRVSPLVLRVLADAVLLAPIVPLAFGAHSA